MEKTIEIPDGYAARIEGNKVILERKESEDKRIREVIESIIRVYGKEQGEWLAGYDMDTLVVHLRDAFAYLERQKEQKPLSTEETELNSIAFLEQMGYTCIPPRKEQPDVELEKEVKRWKNKYGVVGMDDLWINFARHFYELGQRTKYQQDRAEFAKLKAKEWQSGYDEGYAKGLNAKKGE